MTYLTRPVFTFPIHWGDPVSQAFTLDLREVSVGFGAEVFTSLQQFVVSGFTATLQPLDAAALQSYEEFYDDRVGSLKGFWLPAPFEAFQIVAVTSASVFDIAEIGLTDTWNTGAEIHLQFTDAAGTRCGKVAAVVNLGDGRERVTLAAALSAAPASTTTAQRLHYVMLATAAESGSFIAEGLFVPVLKFLELPHEYAVAETGEQPVYLYRFWTERPMGGVWGFTSFAADVVSNGQRFKAWPLTHTDLVDSLDPSRNVTRLVMAVDAAHPLASHPFNLYFPLPPSKPLNVQILEAALATPDVVTVRFTGQVRTVDDSGDRFTARCDSWGDILRRKTPRMMIQSDCNYTVFDTDLPPGAKCCGLERQRFETTLKVTAIGELSVTASLFFPASSQADKWKTKDWFARGFIEYGAGVNYQARNIVSSTWNAGTSRLTLQLNAAPGGLAVGALVQVVPGCDGSAVTCRTKFNNFENFGGFVAIPQRNPALQAIDLSSSQGGKK